MNRYQEKDFLILVDPSNAVCGYESKEKCHQGSGILHRAFSIFIFNDKKELLLQRRSRVKPLWPLFWSNSACSHPRKGEDAEAAAHRRLKEELGMEADLKFLFKFQYQAQFNDSGAENELCYVYIGKSSGKPNIDPREIEECRYIDLEALDRELIESPQDYTPWFKLEWARMRKDHMAEIRKL